MALSSYSLPLKGTNLWTYCKSFIFLVSNFTHIESSKFLFGFFHSHFVLRSICIVVCRCGFSLSLVYVIWLCDYITIYLIFTGGIWAISRLGLLWILFVNIPLPVFRWYFVRCKPRSRIPSLIWNSPISNITNIFFPKWLMILSSTLAVYMRVLCFTSFELSILSHNLVHSHNE